jgi:hypothetical protein
MIHRLISALTKNKDLQQDLWVSYLSGEIDSTFSNKLQQLSIADDIEKRASASFQDILDLNIPQDLLDNLSDLQCTILLMTILGYSLEQVGRYNGVEQVIIDKEMVDLTKNQVWVDYGFKAPPKSRRKIRANRRRD